MKRDIVLGLLLGAALLVVLHINESGRGFAATVLLTLGIYYGRLSSKPEP